QFTDATPWVGDQMIVSLRGPTVPTNVAPNLFAPSAYGSCSYHSSAARWLDTRLFQFSGDCRMRSGSLHSGFRETHYCECDQPDQRRPHGTCTRPAGFLRRIKERQNPSVVQTHERIVKRTQGSMQR